MFYKEKLLKLPMKILTKIHLSGGNAWLIAVLRFDFGKLEVLVIVFVRSHREYNIYLHTEALDEVMYLFFWLDYPNYIRWGSVHVGDMKSLNTEAKLSMSKSWVAQKTNHRFSTIPIDTMMKVYQCRVPF